MSTTTITIGFLLFAVIMFALEKIPLWVTAMIVAVGLAVTGVLDPKDAFAGFTDTNVLLFIAMFIIGAAFFETGMAQKVGGLVTKFAKTERQLIAAVMIITGLMSGILSNTGTAAVLIPVLIGISQSTGINRSKILLPLVFAAAMGGNLSLIGAPGNMIAQSALEGINMEFGFFEYAKVGMPVLIVGIIFFITVGYKLLPEHDNSSSEDSIYSEEKSYEDVPEWKQWASLIVLILTVLAMVFEKQIGIKLFVSAWIGALALVVLKVISSADAIKSIDMNTILLFVGSLALANALQETGTGELIANAIVSRLGENPSPTALLIIIFIICATLTNFMSNTATTALMVPISLSISQAIGADPRAVLMATVIAGSMAYATPIGMPANTMVYNIGGYKFNDYVKAGLPLIIICGAVALILLPILFPFFPN
ncbi:SLC13 family permease [Peptoniphilus sp. MSJ-1]|uniref:SLC13 family permease n=1 Tax=Peptoniphilus ovalis TaxID=2841503 RepID=A0ABS6FF85_9FIRM|nr:SLC13 family permease [Peptoniphilus ovalis]MBU5668703.1 SLC13 family permease [Peptoniphilus ovalis]